jgi:hypothetical protein
MKIDNKVCFSCIAKHVCGPAVTPNMQMCVDFLKAVNAKSMRSSQNMPCPMCEKVVCICKDMGTP